MDPTAEELIRQHLQNKWHGFSTWANALRAAMWLTSCIAAVAWFGLTYALDPRYAKAEISSKVEDNGKTARAVQADVRMLSGQIKELKLLTLSEKMFELQIRVCNHADNGNFWIRELRDMKERYRSMNDGIPWVAPTCEEIGE